ncbi:small glutamine-rich tetratricopeptide repeat-containing protein alpha-like isoform X2 [Hypanus sabinus]|uniref:small glutamine-rich tetratricopeptide repeat-containing protein alpha-like isoform X2 n=1 Tax=Hypanus sabinus TaxID=79690 RepID=UPI0028C4DF4F|nr:small glutamine-rich tetratricopeptide repeat-containing protein alpha-like isoform X2 [Hypanus sabinus]
MTDNKRLAYSIIQFLRDQLQSGDLTSDAQESLEVAVQCLETAFSISVDNEDLAVSRTLPEIFAAAVTEEIPNVVVDPVLHTPTAEDISKAELLKTEGNEQMKIENYQSAVDYYTKAIELNPNNAVYFCNRAAAYSKLGNYGGAVQDCEKAIAFDPCYSKAYGRMGLALASLNKYSEAVNYYKKALELDPDNESYKANLSVAEQKIKDAPSPASNLMQNSQVQQLVSGMMSGSYGPVGGSAGGPGTGANDIAGLIQAGQQFAQQMQQQNPELIEQLRSQIRSRTPSASNEEQS